MLKGTRVLMDDEARRFVAAIDDMRRCLHIRGLFRDNPS